MNQRPRGAALIAVWCVAAVPPLLFLLHATALAPLSWTQRSLEGFEPGPGFAYSMPLDTWWMSRQLVGYMAADVLEDGRRLACPDSPATDIASIGQGSYVLDRGTLFMAASDNSDPRANGRRYELRWPTPPSAIFLTALLIVSGSAAMLALWWSRHAIGALVTTAPLWLSLSIVVIALLAHRAWSLIDVPLPSVQPDSGSYYILTRMMLDGEWPRFEIRPPAYPLFLAAVLAVSPSLFGVMVIQTAITAAAACTLVYAVHRLHRPLALGAAIAMAGFVTGIGAIEHDTAVLSESLYVNAIVFSVALTILGVAVNRAWPFAFASAAGGITILTRPAGLFLVGPFLLCLAYLAWTRRSRRILVAAAVPLPALLLAISTYNYATAGVFNVTAWGEANFAVATFTMWREHPSYPPPINAKVAEIRQVIDGRLTDDDRAALAQSWDPYRLAPAFLKGFWQPALNAAAALSSDYLESRRWIRRVAVDSVAANPVTYAKFVWTMAYLFYLDNVRYNEDFGELMKFRVQSLFADGSHAAPDPVRAELLSRYQRQPLPASVWLGGGCRPPNAVGFAATPTRRLYKITQEARDLVFARALWPALAALVFVASVVRLARSRGTDAGSFILVFLGAVALGAGAVVCLVEYAGHRYSYPTEFVYALMVALTPLLWVRPSATVDVRH
jgi:hypothetical protein